MGVEFVFIDLFGTLIVPPAPELLAGISRELGIKTEANSNGEQWLLQNSPMAYLVHALGLDYSSVREFLLVNQFIDGNAARRSIEKYFATCISDSIWEITEALFRHFIASCSLVPGVLFALEQLRAFGMRLAIASNIMSQWVPVINILGLGEYFDGMVLSCEVGHRKPDCLFFESGLRRMGWKAESTLMIGDNFISDIVGARVAGMKTLWFQSVAISMDEKDRIQRHFNERIHTSMLEILQEVLLLNTQKDMLHKDC